MPHDTQDRPTHDADNAPAEKHRLPKGNPRLGNQLVSAKETPNRRVANGVTKEGVMVGSSEGDKLGFLPFPLPMLCPLGHSVQPQRPALRYRGAAVPGTFPRTSIIPARSSREGHSEGSQCPQS